MAFTYKLEHGDGTPAEPLGRQGELRVIYTRLDEGTDGDPIWVFVVESA